MLYAERDPDGRIVALTHIEKPGAVEVTAAMEAEVAAFLANGNDSADPRWLLGVSDSTLIRAIEDLVNLLIDKQIIRFTDLPLEVQRKITARRQIRQKLSSETLVVDDIL